RGYSTRRKSFVITSGVTARRGSHARGAAAACPRSICGRRRGGSAAGRKEDVKDTEIVPHSAVVLRHQRTLLALSGPWHSRQQPLRPKKRLQAVTPQMGPHPQRQLAQQKSAIQSGEQE